MANAQDLINQWQPKHGQVQGQPYATNPEVTDADGYKIPNPEPTYRYTFADGSYLETDSSGAIKDSHEATAAANADKPVAVGAPPTEQFILTRDPKTGALSSQPNPNYVQPKPGGPQPRETVQMGQKVYERQPDGSYKVVLEGDKAPRIVGGTSSADKQLIIEDAAGNRSFISNPNYVAPRPTQIGTNTTDRVILQQNADGTTSQIDNPNYTAPKPVLAAGGTPADRYIVTMGADGTLTNVANPNYKDPDKVAAAFDSHQAALKRVDQLVADGEMTAAQATTTKSQLDAMLSSALRGSTPAADQIAANDQANQERTRQLAEATGQVDALKAQSAQGQSMLDSEVKAGSATPISMSSLKLAAGPLQQAFQIMQSMAHQGKISPDWIPTPAAPAPYTAAAASAPTTPQAPMPYAPSGVPGDSASQPGALDSYPQAAY